MICGAQEVSTDQVDDGVGPVAFYGRCSTEDNQDPETSYGWQFGNARKFVELLGGEIVADFFDIGQSRSVPWERRHETSRLLAALKDPRREWNAVVVGEGTRCWFGNQFSLIAPRFAAYGVDLWVPELGDVYDARNPSHKMLMSVLGGMSESECQLLECMFEIVRCVANTLQIGRRVTAMTHVGGALREWHRCHVFGVVHRHTRDCVRWGLCCFDLSGVDHQEEMKHGEGGCRAEAGQSQQHG